ncbi:recombinase family protein [Pantoea ananatis]|uniref:recombinase family protein n=1 Tax=Pantoea ananas TaxID=553 RepID=UPI00197EE807|nr:recombinase family protein [Pantoea ananatis]
MIKFYHMITIQILILSLPGKKKVKMPAIFAYYRVSRFEESLESQCHKIYTAGFVIEPCHVFIDQQPGDRSMGNRPVFQSLLFELCRGDILVTSNISYLGNSAEDILSTLRALEKKGIVIYCLNISRNEIAEPHNEIMFKSIEAVAQLEKNKVLERMYRKLSTN